MKKFCKFLFGTATLAAIAGGIYYFYKNYIKKDSNDDLDDFEDDFDDMEEDAAPSDSTDNREYVSINIAAESTETEAETEKTTTEEV